jgi:hypothetical protein
MLAETHRRVGTWLCVARWEGSRRTRAVEERELVSNVIWE